MTYTEAMGVLKKAHDTNKFEFDPIVSTLIASIHWDLTQPPLVGS